MKITKDQLQKLVKEGVQKLHKITLLENEKKELMKELGIINIKDLLNESEIASPEIVEILNGYLEAALWSEEDRIGEANIESDISDDAKIDAYIEIKKFVNQAGDLLNNIEPSQIGHDIWLTRSGHGAGFWDRGLGEIGDKLSDIASDMGEKSLFWGEDGKIHIE